MPTQRKIEIVQNLKASFGQAQAYLFLDFRGLTMANLSQLRQTLAKLGATLTVAKNSLIEKATGLKNEGPTAVLLVKDDALASIKAVAQAAKNFTSLQIKNGFFDGRAFSGSELLTIAQLPSREVLLSRLCGSLQSPLSRLAIVLSGSQRKLVIVLSSLAHQKA